VGHGDDTRASSDRPAGPPPERNYRVGEVARLAGVSVRTLRHYDAIGLVRPAVRGDNGYRRYGQAELERLQKVLAYRELGFDLHAIAAVLDEPATGRLDHLRRQRALLDARLRRLEAMRRTLDKTMEAIHMGIRLDPEELLEVFGDDDPTEHASEAEERWGSTDAYRQSGRRTASYGKAEWLEIRRQADAIEARLAEALAAGVPATDARAMDAAEGHRQHIARWYYDCDPTMHAGLADLYEADPRFRAHYEKRAPGLADYIAAAVRANAARR